MQKLQQVICYLQINVNWRFIVALLCTAQQALSNDDTLTQSVEPDLLSTVFGAIK